MIMTFLRLVAAIATGVAVVCFFNLTPVTVADDVLRFATRKKDLRTRIHHLREGSEKHTLGDRLVYMQQSLEAMGKGAQFGRVICWSLILAAVGAVIAVLLKNYFLVPVFSAALAIMPFIYTHYQMERYEHNVAEELESALSIITTSYMRSDDIIGAVKENLVYIRPPLYEHFSAFITDATMISTEKKAIANLKAKVDDEIFKEWCDGLLRCQDDSTLKETLQPIINKLSIIRQVNTEMKGNVAGMRTEYYTMVAILVGNVPLVWVLNKDWFHTLCSELPGQIVLGICGTAILITYLLLVKYTKPVKFKG